MRAYRPSEREFQIRGILWAHGSATTAEVQGALNDTWEPEIERTTALKHLRALRLKRWVTVERDVRGYRYRPAVDLDAARRQEMDRVTDLFFEGHRAELFRWLIHDRMTSRGLLEGVRIVLAHHIEAAPLRPATVPQRYGSTGSTRCDG